MISKNQIQQNINWLLNNASVPVQYLTKRDLLQEDPQSDSMKLLFSKVEKSSVVTEIFSKQAKDGSWCSGGSWAMPPSYLPKSGYTPVSPKYVTTAWILPLLGDMGYTIADKRIERACDYMLSYQTENGFIGETYPEYYKTKYELLPAIPCRFSIMLIAPGKVGAIGNPRVKKAFDLLVRWQQKDGGWISEFHRAQKNWNRSCPFVSYHATMALYSTGKKEYQHAVKKGLKFLLWHLSTKNEKDIKRFFYHGHSIIHELLMFSEYNIGLQDKAIQTIFNWLLSMYQAQEGYFKYAEKPISKYSRKRDFMDSRVAKYRLFHLIEDDWLTFYALRIMKNITSD